MAKKTKFDLDAVIKSDTEESVDAAVDEAVDIAADVTEVVETQEPELTPKPAPQKPEPVRVVVTEAPKAPPPKLSARTLAEMERGRRALAERNGK